MASPLSAFGVYLADSLKIFLLPVSTIRNAAGRNISIGTAAFVLVLMSVVAGLIQYVIGQMPGGIGAPPEIAGIVQQIAAYIVFFLIALGLLYALVVIFGGTAGFTKLFAAKLTLSSAVVGALLIGLIGKMIIGLLFLGVQDGVGGGLVLLGEQFGLLAIGLIVAVYTIIVARFGGAISWPKALIAAVVHFALMVAIVTAYGMVLPQNDLFDVQRTQQI